MTVRTLQRVVPSVLSSDGAGALAAGAAGRGAGAALCEPEDTSRM